MKHIIIKVMGIISIFLLCCTLICGAWVGSHPNSDMKFHAMLSGSSVIFSIITQIAYMNKCRFCKKHVIK